jgi:MoaA/NifB/PqqE/SkfB family radical SAM enzyme
MTAVTTNDSSDLLARYREGLTARNNYLASYLHLMPKYFRCIDEKRFNEVPAPLSVQVHVSARCTTRCVMCQHWREEADGLPLETWRNIFIELSSFGVQTVTFSGGEPLARADFVSLLESATAAGLHVGMLTSGTMAAPEFNLRKRVLDSIAEHVDWVQVSIDGLEMEDARIRNPLVPARFELLHEFFTILRDTRPRLSIALTLQKPNIDLDLPAICRRLQREFRSDEIIVKLATGSDNALSKHAAFLPDTAQLLGFLTKLQNASEETQTSNLAYLSRSFTDGIFSIDDVSNGAPVRSFYAQHEIRCYTPYLFSLIDSDGQVYPCCHLYRDNHSFDRRTIEFRARHSMGNAATTRFREIWNNSCYVDERKNLLKIDPTHPAFTPCGECTRHCRHNLALTQIHADQSSGSEVFGEMESGNKRPVWF